MSRHPDLFCQAYAKFSQCGKYRFSLARRWDFSLPICGFIMLNPSTADGVQDDPTIRRCRGFAEREGCGGLLVLNLFNFRATKPKEMLAAEAPEGPDADAIIMERVHMIDGPLIAAWGDHGAHRNRAARVLDLIEPYRAVMCLGRTKAGHPRHPLYVKKTAPLVFL